MLLAEFVIFFVMLLLYPRWVEAISSYRPTNGLAYLRERAPGEAGFGLLVACQTYASLNFQLL
jgi:hypothetical protein